MSALLAVNRNARQIAYMFTHRQNVDLLASLVAQQEKTRLERIQVRRLIDDKQKLASRLRDREIILQNQIHEQRILQNSVPLPTTAPPSSKNIPFLRAWSALQAQLAHLEVGQTLRHGACTAIVRSAVFGIPDSTIRSQLHRLKKRGLIEKIGSDWRLTKIGKNVEIKAENQDDLP